MSVRASKPYQSAGMSPMGVRSPLVLAKLGFDLRAYYEGLLDDPLPEEISRPLWALAAREDQVN